MELRIRASKLLKFARETNKRFLVFRGGARSTKSYSLLQYVILYCFENTNRTVTICRKTFPALKATIFRDFRDILQDMGLFDEDLLNKTDLTYQLNGNLVEFISIDQPQKIRGRKRDLLYINECNELDVEDFRQLEIRTTGRILLDYNPSFNFGWVYDLEEQKPDEMDFLVSTYLDNPFLEKEVVRALESYKDTDPDFWQVFGLGERGKSSAMIYPNYITTNNIPDGLRTQVGVDFGWNHPAAVVRVHFGDGVIYVEQLLHESYLTTGEMIARVKDEIRPGETLYCDSARPDAIAEMRSAGLLAVSADKSVKAGIDNVKKHKLVFHSGATALIEEARNYRWKQDAYERLIDEPVKMRDDGMDAMRYAVRGDGRKVTGTFDYDFAII